MAKVLPVLELHLLRFGERTRGPRSRSRGRPREKGIIVPLLALTLRPADKVVLLDLLSRQARDAEVVECCLSDIASTTGYCSTTIRDCLRSLIRQGFIECDALDQVPAGPSHASAGQDDLTPPLDIEGATEVVHTDSADWQLSGLTIVEIDPGGTGESDGCDDGGIAYLEDLLSGKIDCD